MKLIPQSSPYIRKNVSVARMMTDVIIALMPVTVFAMIQNGFLSFKRSQYSLKEGMGFSP